MKKLAVSKDSGMDSEDDEVSELKNDSFLFQTTLDFKLVDTKITNLSSENEVEITFKLDGNQVNYVLKSNFRRM